MQVLRFKKKLTFNRHKNVISNEDHGAYHDTYIKAHTAIYMNVMDIVLNNFKNTIRPIVTHMMDYTLLPKNLK